MQRVPVRRPEVGALAALIGVAGILAALLCGLLAFVLSTDVGLFGDANSPVERVIGVTCSLVTGPLLMAGLLYAGIRRRDVSVLVPAGLVAAAVSAAVTVLAL